MPCEDECRVVAASTMLGRASEAIDAARTARVTSFIKMHLEARADLRALLALNSGMRRSLPLQQDEPRLHRGDDRDDAEAA